MSAQAQAGGRSGLRGVFQGGKWFWADAAPGVTCRLEERDIAPDVEALPPGSLFTAGRFTLAAYPGPDTLALIVFDPQRRQLLDFEHLLYFPPDRRYAVKARLEKFAEQKRGQDHHHAQAGKDLLPLRQGPFSAAGPGAGTDRPEVEPGRP